MRTTNHNVNEIIEAVAPYFKLLGIGGMGTRGFGRLELCVEDSLLLQNDQHGQNKQGAPGGEKMLNLDYICVECAQNIAFDANDVMMPLRTSLKTTSQKH